MGIIIAELIPELLAILAQAPSTIANVKKVWALATATTAPTADEQAVIDAAFEASYKAVQDS